MSLLRIPALRAIASKVGGLRDRLGLGRPTRSVTERSFRRLMVDPLEQRQLLSLSPMSPFDTLVNERFGGMTYDTIPSPSQNTTISQAVAVDDDGDFIVAWTRYDAVVDSQGNPIINPYTGTYWTDANIYARYFTDEVQRITLPSELASINQIDTKHGQFSLRVGGNEVQKITVSAAYAPYLPAEMQSTITGQFALGLDVNGDGSVDGNETVLVSFDELTPEANARAMQIGLQGLSGRAADVQVQALGPEEYLVYFGAASGGDNMPEIVIDPAFVNFTSGFFPGVLVTTEREPITIEDVYVSPSDPNATARLLEQAFVDTIARQLNSKSGLWAYSTGPTDFPPEYRIPGQEVGNGMMPYISPTSSAYANWRISVRPVVDPTTGQLSKTTFDVTFVGAAGKINHPEMVITKAVDEYGNSYLSSSQVAVTTIKESSPEFRVNDPEPEDAFTLWPDVTNQTAPAVAMDADGDFVITWQSEVRSDAGTPSTSDIYARRFKPAGWVETPSFVQSVIPLGNQFQVNTDTTGIQDQAAIGMDYDGNFTIAWVSTGQDVSFFNRVSAQRYDRDGNRLGGEFVVMGLTNQADTSIHHDPYVSMSDQGHVLFTWTETDDPYYTEQLAYTSVVNARIFTPGMGLTAAWLVSGNGGASTSNWDPANQFIISWDMLDTNPANVPGNFEDVYAQMYSVDEQGIYVERSTFRINSASFNTGTNTSWPGDQLNGQAMLDADGDIVVVYEGYGADVSEFGFIDSVYFGDLINSQKNADLLPFLSALSPVPSEYGATPSVAGGNGDMDAEIEALLINAMNMGATNEQIGRLRLILEMRGSLLKGEASAVLFSRFDASPGGDANELYSESIANAERDGHNSRYILTIDDRCTTGSFTVRVTHGLSGQSQTITITPVYTGNPAVINANQTAQAIEEALEEAGITGINWPDPGHDASQYDGPVEVRRIDRTTEWFSRASTPWAWQFAGSRYVYEITFQGECHDVLMELSLGSNNLKIDSDDAPPPEIYAFTMGEVGLEQTDSSAAMQPDGDFVVVWTQTEAASNLYSTNTNIYFREFNESTDTAGPRMTDMMLVDGTRVVNDGYVTSDLNHLIVTFDEELSTSGVNSVLNTANWSLFKDGVARSGMISKIDFGMNMSTTLGLTSVGSNKWEAVLTFDGNAGSAGTPALGAGHYEIRVSNAIYDLAGNAIGRNGYQAQGAIATRSFYLAPPSGTETPVSGDPSGDQYSSDFDDIVDASAVPSSTRSIAGDADGEYVVVWTEENAGVYVRIERPSAPPAVPEFLVTDNPTASYASVAMDDDGDFVVTWSQDDGVGGEIDWNVYFQRFDAMGRPLDAAPRMANAETELAQRFSTVAMDNDGDFVIVWQSEEQDGNGYGIFAQRYNRAGEELGGVGEIQVLSLTGEVTSLEFTLTLEGKETASIQYGGDLGATANQVEAAFAAIGIQVEAVALNTTDLAIQFLGAYGRRDLPPLEVNLLEAEGDLDPGIDVIIVTEGVPSEFQVNDTVGGNQVFPSVAMSSQGDYLISWTSFGQNGDGADDSNIYAKRFGSGEEFVSPTDRLARLAERWNWTAPEGVEIVPYMVTVNPPDFYIVPPGSGYDGVVLLGLDRSDGFGLGSGTLLPTGYHILTAAHNVCDDNGNLVANNVEVVFGSPTGLPGDLGPTVINSSAIYVLPGYDGAPWSNGADLAIIVLETRAPDEAQRWDIYREGDEVGQNFHMFGYGRYGMGGAGGDTSDPDGWLRHGWNTWEATGEMFAEVLGEHYSSDSLLSDFDDPMGVYDTFGSIFGMPHTGLGANEASSAPGDSGGPCFIGNRIAGVVSYGIVVGQPDPFPGLNSSYSDLSADQRVSTYADWIDAMTECTPEFLVNTTTLGDQKWSSVAMDADGDYVITWTSHGNDGSGSGYGLGYGGEWGIFAQRYTAGNIPVGGEIRVNTYTSENQQRPQVAMDADGDFIVTWESFQDRPAGGSGPDTGTSYGVYAQRYMANSKMSDPLLGQGGRLGGEIHVNTTIAGDQRYPSVFLSDSGNAVVAWTGPDASGQGLFTRRLNMLADDAGPTVTDVLVVSEAGNSLETLVEGDTVAHAATYVVVRFGEDVSHASSSALMSVLNPNNWELSRFGTTLAKGVRSVSYGISKAYQLGYESQPSGKYEAVLTLDGDPAQSGSQAVKDGTYVLTLKSAVEDLAANDLDGNYDGTPGGNFTHAFSILTTGATPKGDVIVSDTSEQNPRTYPETPNAIAADADGDHVIVWTATDPLTGLDRVYIRLFDASGTPQGAAFEVTHLVDAFAGDNQRHASVAMDADGDFVVTWTNYRGGTDDGVDIYARRFQANGTPQPGGAFRVNTYTTDVQIWSDVAMDLDGDFVVTWSSYGQEDNGQNGYGYGVYARRFDSLGMPLGTEFQVNVTETGNQQFPSIAMDATGDFLIGWTSDQVVDGDDIIARAFKWDGSPMPIDNSLALVPRPIGINGGEILVNTTTAGDQRYCDVGMDQSGQRFIVAWSSSGKDTSGFGVYARMLSMNADGYVVPSTRDPYEFRVNTSVTWNQMYPSVSMEWDGGFIVTWSGHGTRQFESATSGYGVFYQRFDALGQVIGDEYRANAETVGNQWFSSVATDAQGNFFLVWTGEGETTGSTQLYRYVGENRFQIADTIGPVVTDVLKADGTRERLLADTSLSTSSSNGLTQLIVVFSENLSTAGGTTGLESILNSNNWVIKRGGSELPLGVHNVSFGYNVTSRKYEAVITFDSNGLNPGQPGLVKGDYTLSVRDSVTDGVNRLDGDLDGVAGTSSSVPGIQGFNFHFSVADNANLGPEYRVNENTSSQQTASAVLGTGMALEGSNRSVAIDHDGDFVVVWTSYGVDPSDPSGDVYMRFYDRNNNALPGDIRVNQYTTGHQRNAEVAMDADGDFVVVWESEGQDIGGSYAIYGRRFDATGNPLGDEFRINSEYIGDQTKPAVAMNNQGDFVVTYVSTHGQNFSYFQEIIGQRFNRRGEPVGVEFQINQNAIPNLPTVATTEATVNPAVAMDEQGGFIVTWDRFTAQVDGWLLDSNIVARMFNPDGTARTDEFRVDYSNISDTTIGDTFTDPEHREAQNAIDVVGPTDIRRTARNPQIAIDGQGNFTIVWESWRDNDIDEDTDNQGDDGSRDPDDYPDSYGIYFHQFNAEGSPRTNFDYNANMVNTLDTPNHDPHFTGAQVNPSVALDIDGDLVVVWNGLGCEPSPYYSSDPTQIGNFDAAGIFIRYFTSSAGPNVTTYASQQQRVNYTEGGTQQFPTIVAEPDGDYLVVWSGAGVGDQHGLFFRRYNEASDSAGPLVTDLQVNGAVLENGGQVIETVQTLVVTFDEDLTRTGVNGVLNLANWSLLKNGVKLTGGIKCVEFGLNPLTNKWEATLTLDGNGATSGTPALGGGYYEVVVSNAIRDVAGNALGRTGYAELGASASRTFYVIPPTGSQTVVNTDNTAGDQIFLDPTDDPDMIPNSPRSIAGDADGEHVVVWTSTDPSSLGVWVKVYRTEWTGTGESRTSTVSVVKEFRIGTLTDTARYASVARDGDGDFVVTWQEYNSVDANSGWDIWFQRFDALGNARGPARVANGQTLDDQLYASVAMDIDGDFVIAWQSDGQDGSGWGVYAQAYSRDGEALGGLNEIQVLSIHEATTEATFKLEYDDDNDPETPGVLTDPITYNGNLEDTAAQIVARLADLGVTVEVEVLNETDLAIQFVGDYGTMDVAPLVVTELTTDGSVQLHVETEGEASEFRVNDTTEGDQLFASAGMDAQGNYIISWTSFGQDGDAPDESNIYAKRFASMEVLVGSTGSAATSAVSSGNDDNLEPLIVTVDDPADHETGAGYDGVCRVFAGDSAGTGTLLTSGYHIITAAHVVADDFGNALPVDTISVMFNLPEGDLYIQAADVFVHPGWNGNPADGSDLAIIVLATAAPVTIQRYDIYRESDEIGKVFEKWGFGRSGTGSTGDTLEGGTERKGQNKWEANDSLFGWSGDCLIYDFDNGKAENDAFGIQFGLNDTGLGDDEIGAAPGDSGGPSFINGLIAGVTSYRSYSPGAAYDVVPGLNSSFGDSGGDVRVSLFASWIDAIVGGSSPEFLVNSIVDGDQKWSSVAMDLDGDYVITWTTHNQNGTVNGPGGAFIDQNAIAARRFNSDNTALGAEFQVNTYTAENQQHSQVAMDADGDFMITWESFQEPITAATSYGVYAQRFAANDKLTDPYVGVDGRVGSEIHVNATTGGDQRMPSVALSHAGDALVVWTGPGANGIDVFSQRYNVLTDQAGPVVTDVLGVDIDSGELAPVLNGQPVTTELSQFVVLFGENLNTAYSTSGPNSILNPNNWVLTRDGEVVNNAIKSIVFGFNAATNKYQAIVTIDGDPDTAGVQTLPDGEYRLTIRDNVMDRFGNRLDGNYDGTPGGDYNLTFTVVAAGIETRVNTDPDGKQVFVDEALPLNKTPNSPQSVAIDADGDYGVVWTDQGHVSDEIQTITFSDQWGKFALRYNGILSADLTFTGDIEETAAAIQTALDTLGLATVVAAVDDVTIQVRFTDASGNMNHPQLVAVAPSAGPNISGSVAVATDVEGGVAVGGVFVKLYDVAWTVATDGKRTSTATERQPINPATGLPWRNNEICVTDNPTATYASIAMDADGDFVVTWSQNDGTAAQPDWNVYARRYNAMGRAGVAELQKINLSGISTTTGVKGTVQLEWNGLTTGAITIDVPTATTNLAATAAAVETALRALGADVTVTAEAVTSTETPDTFVVAFTIRFTGTQAELDQPAVAVAQETWTTGSPTVEASTFREGDAGEAFRVNAYTKSQQRYSTVAMDHDGDFVIAWQSEGQNGNGYEVYAQAYDRFGNPLAVLDELQVLTFSPTSTGTFKLVYRDPVAGEISTGTISYTGDLAATTQAIQAALDALGLETEVTAQDPSDIEIHFIGADGGMDHKQLLIDFGSPKTITGLTIRTQQEGKAGEFRVNENMEGNQVYASAAMDAVGNFVVTWTSFDKTPNDGDASNIYARQYVWIDSPNTTTAEDVVAGGAEFLVNQTLEGQQRWSDVAMDRQGDFVITWTSVAVDPNNADEQVGAAGTQEVFARRYTFATNVGGSAPVDNQPVADEFQVNSFNRGTQQHSQVAMDADGDFVITWESFQDVPTVSSDQPNSFGVYAQAYVRNDQLGIVGGANGELDDERAINGTKVGAQRLPGVALDDTGDIVIVWSGRGDVPGQEDDQGIFMRREGLDADVAGPTVTDVLYKQEPETGPDTLEVVLDGSLIRYNVNQFVVVFSEDLNQIYGDVGAHSILNPEHWQLLRNGVVLEDGIKSITFGLNQAYLSGLADAPSGKYEAVLTFDADVTKPGNQALDNGTYVITINDMVQDVSANAFDGDVNGTPGHGFQHQFIIRAGEEGGDDPVGGDDDVISGGHTHPETLGAVAMDADGDYVVAWTAYDSVRKLDRAYIRLYNASGDPKGPQVEVTSAAAFPAFANDQQRYVTTAMDADGDFVVTWTNYRDTDGNVANGYEEVDVYARRYSAVGKAGVDELLALRLSGISSTNGGVEGSIRLSWNGRETGDIALSIASSTADVSLAAAAVESALKAIGANVTVKAAAAASTTVSGTFVVTFSIEFQGTQAELDQPPVTFVQQTWTKGTPQVEALNVRDGNPGAPIRVNNYTYKDQKWSDVAMDVDGDFVVTWSSFGQEDGGQGRTGYGVYARRYDRFGYAYGPEFQVNTTVAGDQQFSSVAMGAEGEFVITWQSSQNGVGDDIIARVFNADGSSITSPLTGEFTVNDTLAGNQRYPDIAMDLAGKSYVITWSSSQQTDDPSGYGVYAKRFDRLTLEEMFVRYAYQGDPVDFGEGETIEVPIVVDQDFRIADLNVRLNISHEDPSDLFVWLVSPSGTTIALFQQVPAAGDQDGFTITGPNGINFDSPLFDDEAAAAIGAGQPPFDGAFRPLQALTAFDEETSGGTWLLRIRDNDPANDPDVDINTETGAITHHPDGGRLWSWSLEFTRDPAATDEVLVNGTTLGNQMYSSVAMDHVGNAIVVWSGYGTEPGQEDTSGYGVFAMRLTTTLLKLVPEQRINRETAGMQWLPSVAMDGEGNFVVAWTGDTATAGVTNVYQYLSVENRSVDGPLVTDVFIPTTVVSTDLLTPLLDGGVADAGLKQLVVAFGENLSVEQAVVNGVRSPAIESVLNPNNWALERNGEEIHGGIVAITFGLNPQTNRYEARLTFDGNGLGAGQVGLLPGDYTLVVRDQIEDLRGNRLDGDYDSQPGTLPDGSGHSGFSFHFSVPEQADTLGTEMRVNQSIAPVQILSEPKGTGYAREVTTMSVAVDHDGDYVVVWTMYAQDSPVDTDVYFRLYDRNNNPLTDETRVNNITAGKQGNAAVAMDADGDFVVVWESVAADGTLDVYAQRFNALGQRIAVERTTRIATDPNRNVANAGQIEALVNTTIAGQQYNPAVSMDSFGNYIVVWGMSGQNFGYLNNVYAQRFNFRGEPVAEEFQINVANLPGAAGPGLTPSFLVNQSVDLGDDGSFVVAWDRALFQTSGVVTNSDVLVRVFDDQSNPLPDEIVVNADEIVGQDPTHVPADAAAGGSDVERIARNPQVARDTLGNFIVVFESYLDNDYLATDTPDSYGIYYRRFDALGTPLTEGVQQANLVVSADEDAVLAETATQQFAFDQVNPTIAMDADGDFAIFWNGNGAQPDQYEPENPELVSDFDDAGVFGRWFHAGTDAVLSYPTTPQQRANETVAGTQQFPAIAMEPDGDAVLVWAGAGVGDRHGIFARHYEETADTAGPMATELRMADGANEIVGPGDNIYGNPSTLLVIFDEKLNTDLTGPGGTPGLHSVENVNNWTLVNGRGEEINGAIHDVKFRFNVALNKWTAEVSFTGSNGNVGPLANGTYTLVARSAIHDEAGNALARTGYQPYGTGRRYAEQGNELPLDPVTRPTGGVGVQFRVNNTVPGDAPWGDLDQLASRPEVTLGQENLALVAYQDGAVVARNATGQYVVVWVEYREVIDSSLIPPDPNVDPATLPVIPAEPVLEANIMAQRFDASCREVGEPILVNSLTVGEQIEPAVAMDDGGNFVVIWSGDGTAIGDATGVFGQRFDVDGVPLGGQFRVNDYLNSYQSDPAVAMNPNTGDFVVTWTSYGQDGSRNGIYARRYRASGQPYAAEFRVNTTTSGSQATSDIAMDATGAFVVVWASEGQDASGWAIYGQRFSASGAALGSEFRVNTQQNGDQIDPAVARDRKGNFVVTWSSRQDGSGLGVYAQRFNASGVKQGSEFRVNQTTIYDQFEPDVAMSPDGIFVITWTSFNQDTPYDENLRDWGVYARMYNANGTDYTDPRVGSGAIGEFRVNAQTEGNQYAPSVAMDAAGHYIVVWSGQYDVVTTLVTPPPIPDGEGGTEEQEPVETQFVVSGIYTRFIDPPSESDQDAPLGTVSISGTSGNDVFEFIGGPTSGSWVVKLNGEVLSVGLQTGTLRFDGKGGQDTVNFVGGSASDRTELWADRGTFTSDYYTFEVSNVEIITANGGLGADVVYLHDGVGDDVLTVNPQSATLVGTGVNLTANGYESFYGIADGGGSDTVELYDTAGDATLTTTPTYAEMAGSGGYYAKASLFEKVKAYASTGADVAKMYDSAGNDKFVASPKYALFTGTGFYILAAGFPKCMAYGTAGGRDVATLTGSPQADKFDASSDRVATYYGTGFYNRVESFDVIQATGNVAEQDVAVLRGSDSLTAGDLLVLGRNYGKLTGAGYEFKADYFRDLTGHGGAGLDTVRFYDSADNDVFKVSQAWAEMRATDYRNRALGFETVEGHVIIGGTDVAELTDTAMNDYLEAEDDWARLSSTEAGINYLAHGFSQVTASSRNDGDKKRVLPELDFLFAATGRWGDE